jgi:hypothetical protein
MSGWLVPGIYGKGGLTIRRGYLLRIEGRKICNTYYTINSLILKRFDIDNL